MTHQSHQTTVDPVRLSVIIIARDEADRIEQCLNSVVPVADEIIVLDSGSTDGTPEICRRYTDRVYLTDWPGYGPQKQRALEKAQGEWVLSIDADEALTPRLREEIRSAVQGATDAVGFRLPWAVHVFGTTLKHGRSARAPLRLFRRGGAGFSNDIVHERVIPPPGKIGRMKGRLMHYTHRDFGHALYKNADYAWLGARRRYRERKQGYGLIGASLRGILVFFQVYFLRGGFLDGPAGFLMAVLYSQVAFNKYAGLWALYREAECGGRKAGAGMDGRQKNVRQS